jgi:transcriptional regulator with XRE-family HTH domain
MPITLKDKLKELSPAQRKQVEARAAELLAEEMTLRELRHARKLTQVKMAKTLGVTQDSVSRLEKRSDLLLSTLRRTVEAMGGYLRRSPSFPTVRRWFSPALPKMIRGQSRQAGDVSPKGEGNCRAAKGLNRNPSTSVTRGWRGVAPRMKIDVSEHPPFRAYRRHII